jgi:ferric-dicitrate binding protein FerR (iron transport regulator)
MQNLARPIAALARARNQLLNLVERKVAEISVSGRCFVRCQAIRIHGQ